VKIIRGKQVFAPLKNDKVHDIPLTDNATLKLSEYIRQSPRKELRSHGSRRTAGR
jgi:hypothetical protein